MQAQGGTMSIRCLHAQNHMLEHDVASSDFHECRITKPYKDAQQTALARQDVLHAGRREFYYHYCYA